MAKIKYFGSRREDLGLNAVDGGVLTSTRALEAERGWIRWMARAPWQSGAQRGNQSRDGSC
jgi:hypothetical protein